MAASQCPRCSEPLQLRDDYGNEVPLSRCGSCDTYYPRSAGACRWCGTAAPRARTTWLPAATVLVLLGGASWAGFRYLNGRDAAPTRAADAGSVAIADAPAKTPAVQQAAVSVPAAAESSTARRITEPPAARRVADPAPTTPPVTITSKPKTELALLSTVAVAPRPAASAPPGEWIGAVSTTWVNVRGHPSRDSAVVAVIKPESRVRLAQSRTAWTRVTAPGAAGWVDRRLFAIDSTKPPH